MLVHVVEERADMAVSAVESVRRNLQRSVGAFHASPPSGDRRVQQQSVCPLATSAGLLLRVQRATRRAKSSVAELRGGPALHCGSILRAPSQHATPTAPRPSAAFASSNPCSGALPPIATRCNLGVS